MLPSPSIVCGIKLNYFCFRNLSIWGSRWCLHLYIYIQAVINITSLIFRCTKASLRFLFPCSWTRLQKFKRCFSLFSRGKVKRCKTLLFVHYLLKIKYLRCVLSVMIVQNSSSAKIIILVKIIWLLIVLIRLMCKVALATSRFRTEIIQGNVVAETGISWGDQPIFPP